MKRKELKISLLRDWKKIHRIGIQNLGMNISPFPGSTNYTQILTNLILGLIQKRKTNSLTENVCSLHFLRNQPFGQLVRAKIKINAHEIRAALLVDSVLQPNYHSLTDFVYKGSSSSGNALHYT